MNRFYSEYGADFNTEILRDNVKKYGNFVPGEIPGLPIVFEPQGEVALMRMPWYDVRPQSESYMNIRKIKSVIHSDTLHELYFWLQELNQRNLSQHILIEGRVLDNQQWHKLTDDPVWKFMGFEGARRSSNVHFAERLCANKKRNIRFMRNEIWSERICAKNWSFKWLFSCQSAS